MKQGFKRFPFFPILAVPVFMMLMAGVVRAAGPMMMPGFPLRAGAAVIVMWTPLPGATEYKLLKKMETPDFKEVYKGPGNTYNDADAPVSKTIEYQVVAVVGGKDSEPSSVSVLTGVQPLKSPNFTGIIPSSDAITLRWSNPPGSVFFNLYRSEKKDGPYDLLGSYQQETFTDRKLDKTKTYYYKVTAVDRNNTESEKSAIQEAKLAEVAVALAEEKLVIRKAIPKGSFTGEAIYGFEQPTCMALFKNGNIAVFDPRSIQFSDQNGKYLRRIKIDPKWGGVGSVSLDRDENFLMVFYGDKMIRRVSSEDGRVLQEITYPEELTGKVQNNPNGFVVDKEGNMWIADGKRFQLIKLDPSAKPLAVYGRLFGTYSAKTITPEDTPTLGMIYLNPADGNLYGVLSMSAQIKVFDPKTGKVIKTLGGIGPSLSQFSGIGGLYFRKNGNIMVYDSMMQVLKEYDKDFKYVATIADLEPKGAAPKLSADMGNTFLYNETINRLYVISSMGNQVYMFDMPK